jgi:hypothetical protein
MVGGFEVGDGEFAILRRIEWEGGGLRGGVRELALCRGMARMLVCAKRSMEGYKPIAGCVEQCEVQNYARPGGMLTAADQ